MAPIVTTQFIAGPLVTIKKMRTYLLLLLYLVCLNSLSGQSGVLIPVEQNGLWGFVNLSNELIIQPEFVEAAPMVNGHSIVKKNGKYGLIDAANLRKIKIKYDSVQNFTKNGYAWVKNHNKWKAIDKNGEKFKEELLIQGPCVINPVYYIDKHNYFIQSDSCISLIYKKPIPSSVNSMVKFSRCTTECSYSHLELLGERTLIVDSAGLHGVWWPDADCYIDVNWKYDEVVIRNGENQAKDLHKFNVGNEWGFINGNGVEVIPAKYISVECFDSKMFDELSYYPITLVEYKENTFGYIDLKGNEYFWQEDWNSD